MEQPPLTDEQIEFFASQNAEAANRASKRTIRRAFVGYLILAVGVLGMYLNGQNVSDSQRRAIVESGTAVVVDSCNRDFNSTQRLRSLLQHADASVAEAEKKGKIQPDQAADAHKFYKDELAAIPLPDCREATTALTDNPNDIIATPTPLHP